MAEGQEGRTVLKTDRLAKEYKSGLFLNRRRVRALHDLSLEVRQGEVFGFLGPNGAGKTTTLQLIIGISRPSGGSIKIFGKPFFCGETWPLGRIGYVPENTFLPGDMTARELFVFFAQLHGLPRSVILERIPLLCDKVGLSANPAGLIRNLSMGQRRLLDLALALVHDPDLVFFDEPTVYLDPLAVERFIHIILFLKEKGKTVFLSSHTLTLIEKLSDRIGIIASGQLLRVAPARDFAAEGGLEKVFLGMVK
jgi:ABC-2 type transport system ATP-binding protein